MKYLVLIFGIFCLLGGKAVNAQTTGYTQIIEGYDYGPAITKLVLQLETDLEQEELTNETFAVEATKSYEKFDFETGESEDVTESQVIEVINVYTSDDQGEQVSDASNFVTLELSVHPDDIFTNPYNYNLNTGKNTDVGIAHQITLAEPLEGLDAMDFTADNLVDKVYKGLEGYNTDSFIYEDEIFGTIDLTYTYYEVETDEAAPLIVLLHGAGEGGTDTRLVLYGNKVVALTTEEIQAYFDRGAHVLAPQTPTMWMDSGEGEYTSDGTSKYSRALQSLIQEYVESHDNIDTDRIYLGGGSNGGYMTVNLAIENPDYYAAIFPICQAYQSEWIDDDDLEKLLNIPIRFVHALNDEVVQFQPTAGDLYDRLVEAGHENVELTTFDNVVDTSGQFVDADGNPYEYLGHWSWIYLYNDEVANEEGVNFYEWLNAQAKN